MAVPVLKQGGLLIASIQDALSDEDLRGLQADIGQKIGQYRSSGVLIDVTALDVLDSFAARTLRTIAESTRLRGAQVVVIGIQPEVAIAMVQMGLSLTGARTALDLEDGIALLLPSSGEH